MHVILKLGWREASKLLHDVVIIQRVHYSRVWKRRSHCRGKLIRLNSQLKKKKRGQWETHGHMCIKHAYNKASIAQAALPFCHGQSNGLFYGRRTGHLDEL